MFKIMFTNNIFQNKILLLLNLVNTCLGIFEYVV